MSTTSRSLKPFSPLPIPIHSLKSSSFPILKTLLPPSYPLTTRKLRAMSTTCGLTLLPALNPSKALSFHNKPAIFFSLRTPNPLTRLVGSFPLSSCNVAFAEEYGQDEEFSFGDRKEDRRVSPDLKVFVGNLPFSIDSSQLIICFRREKLWDVGCFVGQLGDNGTYPWKEGSVQRSTFKACSVLA